MFLNKFDVGIVYVFKDGLIKITFKFLFIRSNIFFSNFLFQLFDNCFFSYIFPWICTIFFSSFPSKNFQVKEFWT
jgi:hypothetical protein